jgi:hypothetical protein
MVIEITIEHALHNSRMKLFLKFDYDRETIELVKKMADAKWSHTHKCWYMSYYNGAISHIKNNLGSNGITLKMLNEYDDVIKPKPIDSKKPSDALPDLDKVQKEKIKKFKLWMQSKRYSENTIGTYLDSIQTFLRYYAIKNLSEINNEDLINFNIPAQKSGMAMIKIYSLTGQVLMTKSVSVATGMNNITLDLPTQLVNGMVLVEVGTDSYNVKKQLVIRK